MMDQLKANWKSGLSVALVSVPLSLSLGIAAGGTPIMGIITAIWAGLIAGMLGGSKFNVVGPAGALAGILALNALQYTPGILPFLAIGAGLISLAVWALGWDKYLIFIPSSVVHGFTLGVALTIGFGQLNAALGLTGLPSHETILENIIESLRNVAATDFAALVPFLIGLGLLFYIIKKKPLWPNSIIVAILGIAAGYASSIGVIPFHMVTLAEKYPALALNLFSIPSLGALRASAAFADISAIAQVMLVVRLSAVVAFVLILETLLSAKIADGMTKTKLDSKKEMLGVALANIVSGIFGGIPASGVFARTALNIKSGATSAYSQIIQALLVGVITFVLLPGFQYIPMSIIASILVYVAIRMVVREHFVKFYTFDKVAFVTSMVVAILSIAYEATTGILVGTAAALLFLVNRISSAQSNITVGTNKPLTETKEGDIIVYRFAGELTYVNSKSHVEMFPTLLPRKAVVLNFRHLFYIDLDGVEALDEIIEHLESKKQNIYLTGIRDQVALFIKEQSWYKHLVEKGHVFNRTEEAVAAAYAHK
mgnify:CR=1 FL=1